MKVEHIIVQAGGKGTRMEHLTYNKPKALVPIDNLPMLFHLFRKYPEAEFVVIGDYKYEVLERYLEAFAEVKYSIVDARGKSGTCAGIGEALKRIPAKEAFMLIWSDLVLPKEYEMPDEEGDYIGISKDFRCRWSYRDGVFKEEPSEEFGVAGHFIFRDKNAITDVPEEGEFVRWLQGRSMIFREYPLYRTKEYGLISEYEKLEKNRCRPFNRITIDGDKIIKEAIDDQGRGLAVRENAWYDKVKEAGFPGIPKIYGTNPIIMERIDGKNIYEYDLALDEKRIILHKLIGCLKEIHKLGRCDADKDSFYDAYIGKTFKRLEKVENLVPFAKEEFITINGIKCRNVFYCKDWLKKTVEEYLPKEFVFIHGDCTFSNMMLKGGTEPVLIDPRGYFGTTELYGDPAYDWAKLYYSLAGNYDQFNLKRFNLRIEDDHVELNIDSNHWEDIESEFFSLLNEDVSAKQIKLLHAIIWLSLTTYAWEDYDSICGAFYNGILHLQEVMEGEK